MWPVLRRENGVIRGVAVLVPTLALGLIGSFRMAVQEHSVTSVHEAVLVELRRATTSTADVRTLALVEDAQHELDSWAGSTISRLRSGRTDLVAADDPQNQIRRIRDVYAWTARTPEFTRALLVLADAHQHRVEALHEMLRAGVVDEQRYLAVEADVIAVWSGIRTWAQPARPASGKPRIHPVSMPFAVQLGL